MIHSKLQHDRLSTDSAHIYKDPVHHRSHPDPDCQFIVEVDASNIGVGAILSQRSAGDSKVHPCAFYLHRLFPAKQNYDIGNKELLAIKLALEEWRQWFEGARAPFQVWTDHKNLEYLQTAKRLNSRQARWALFFSRFNFHPDALSRYFERETKEIEPDTILRPEVFVCAVEMDIEKTVRSALGTGATPSNCLDGKLYVPTEVRSPIIQWGHSSRLSGHPGAHRTTSFIQRKFWWTGMREDISNFVSACSVCAQTKVTHQPPQGPHRPWSHIALDFVTGLPPSNHHKTTLTIVERFSKAVHFFPLTKLPSASETAQLLITHVVRLHGIPTNIVSDRGPQFTARFWKAFCTLIGTTVSHQVFTLSLMARPSGPIRQWRLSSDAYAITIQSLGAHSYRGPRMPSIVRPLLPLNCHFECCLGYHPPLFPSQEEEVRVPSAQAFIRRCRRMWRATHATG